MRLVDTVGNAARDVSGGIGRGRSTQCLFGPAHVVGDATVIPVAEARVRFGLASTGTPSGNGAGLGGGVVGGGMLQVQPLGFITVRGTRADFTPIRDYTRLILLALGCAAVALALLLSLAARRGTPARESTGRRRG